MNSAAQFLRSNVQSTKIAVGLVQALETICCSKLAALELLLHFLAIGCYYHDLNLLTVTSLREFVYNLTDL